MAGGRKDNDPAGSARLPASVHCMTYITDNHLILWTTKMWRVILLDLHILGYNISIHQKDQPQYVFAKKTLVSCKTFGILMYKEMAIGHDT